MAAARSAAQQTTVSRRRQAQACLCIAMGLLALHSAYADTVVHQAGKIAVDPTSDEDASVELNQSTQLGSTGTSGVSAYPTYADGSKVTSANLNHQASPPPVTKTTPSASTASSTVSSGATTAAATTTSTTKAAGVNSATSQLVRSASSTPLVGTTHAASTTSAAQGTGSGSTGDVTGLSGGSGNAALTGYLSGSAASAQGFSAGGGGNSMKAPTQSAGGRVMTVNGGRKLKL